MFVSICIPTYNNAAILRRTLYALGKQTYPGDQYEIVVVDDASTSGTIVVIGEETREDLSGWV